MASLVGLQRIEHPEVAIARLADFQSDDADFSPAHGG
jgi:hypothetical protein